MPKQATEFPHGKIHLFGRDIPLKNNLGVNMKWLTLDERKVYLKFLDEKKKSNDDNAIEVLRGTYLTKSR